MEQQLTVPTALHSAPAAAVQSYLSSSQCLLSSLEMVLITGAQEPILADMILSTSHPRMTCAREADRLRLRLPDGPVRLWTDSTPYSHLCCELSSYSCPKLYLVCWLGLVCTETGISLILVPMDSSPTGFWSPPALGIQHCIAREIHPGPSQ